MDYSLPDSFVHGISQARILHLGSHFFHQGIFPTQGSNPGVLWQADSLLLKQQGSPDIDKDTHIIDTVIFICEKKFPTKLVYHYVKQ